MTSPSGNLQPLKLVVLISGSGSNLQSILDAIAAGTLEAEVSAVISNIENAYGLERARLSDIDSLTLTALPGESRESYDQRLAEIIRKYSPDLIILAGFMRILSAGFVAEFSGRILNIHPSLLPDFKGTNTHQRVLDAEKSEHGATVHVVTEKLDDGPVIMQARVAVQSGDDAQSLRIRVLEQEHIIYPEAIAKYANSRLIKSEVDR